MGDTGAVAAQRRACWFLRVMHANIVITMAGRGKRFAEAGYKAPKYEILAHGRSLFDWSMASLANFFSSESRVVFVCLRRNGAGDFLRSSLRRLPIRDARILQLDEVTDGQATSAYQSKDLWRPDAPLLIYNIDTYIDPNRLAPRLIRRGSDGWLPCARLSGSHWSFVALAEDGWAVDVAEKVRISDYASLGLYWFARAGDFLAAYEHMAGEAHGRAKGERYVAPLYKHVLRSGGKVSISVLPASAVGALGTPRELDSFVQADLAAGVRGWDGHA